MNYESVYSFLDFEKHAIIRAIIMFTDFTYFYALSRLF